MTTSPTKTKQKLSLRKRLFVKKSPKVGCYVDANSRDEFVQSTSRPISPADPFMAHSALYADIHVEVGDSTRNCSYDPTYNNTSVKSEYSNHDDDNNPKCCRTFFRRSRPKSLIDNHPCPSKDDASSRDCSPVNNSNSISDQTMSGSQSKSEDIPKATIKFPKDDPRKCFEHSGSFEGIKTKNKLFVKRLSADHLISNDSKPLFRSSSPESDRSSSLDRKRR